MGRSLVDVPETGGPRKGLRGRGWGGTSGGSGPGAPTRHTTARLARCRASTGWNAGRIAGGVSRVRGDYRALPFSRMRSARIFAGVLAWLASTSSERTKVYRLVSGKNGGRCCVAWQRSGVWKVRKPEFA